MKQTFALLTLLAFVTLSCTKDDVGIESATGKSGSIARFATYNGYMYLLNPNEVLTYSLANPDKPELVNRLQTDYGLETIFIYDNAIFLGSTTALYILNISNPAAPSIQSKTGREFEFWGGCDPVVVRDNYAYSTIKIIANVCGQVNSESALLVYDISNKNNPYQVFNFPLNLPEGLGYADHYLFVCDPGNNRLEVFDLLNPEQPAYLANKSVSIPQPYDLIVDGNKMIVSTKTDFQIYDISALPDIQKIGTIGK